MDSIYNGRKIVVNLIVTRHHGRLTEDFSNSLLKVFADNGENRFNMDYTIIDGKLFITFDELMPCGTYSICAIWTKNRSAFVEDETDCCHLRDRNVQRCDVSNAFSIVDNIEDETTEDKEGQVDLKIIACADVFGTDGLSSYELAVLRGLWHGDEISYLKNTITVDIEGLMAELAERFGWLIDDKLNKSGFWYKVDGEAAYLGLKAYFETELSKAVSVLELKSDAESAYAALRTEFDTGITSASSSIREWATKTFASIELESSFKVLSDEFKTYADAFAKFKADSESANAIIGARFEKIEGSVSSYAESFAEFKADANRAIGVLQSRFTSDGAIVNTAGLVTVADGENSFASLFAERVDSEGIAKKAEIIVYINENESGVKINADRVDIEGVSTSISTNRLLDKYVYEFIGENGIRRTFLSQPTDSDKYDIGDMWCNATYGDLYRNDILVCIQSKKEGETFSIDHWMPASEATSARIDVIGGTISALAAKFTFDEDGNIKNIDRSGLLLSDDAAKLYTTVETTNALGERVTVAEAVIETSVHRDVSGNIESGVFISADQILMNGTVKFATTEDLLESISKALEEAASDATSKADSVKGEITDLKTYIDEAFYDGIISESECISIESWIKQIQSVKENVNNSFAEIESHPILAGTETLEVLRARKNDFINSYNEFITHIENAISDGKITSDERADVDGKYDSFNTCYGNYVTSLNACITYVDEYLGHEIGTLYYLKKALKESTTISGGLVQTSAVVLGYTNDSNDYVVMAGTNGVVTSKGNRTPAFWMGGDMVDLFDVYNSVTGNFDREEGVRYATGMDRMDGTGYRANGNLWWDNDGKIHADPLSFFVGDNSAGGLLAAIQVVFKSDGIHPDYLIPQVPFHTLHIADRLRIGDALLKYDPVNKAIYATHVDGSTDTIGFYSEGWVSAKGANPSSGGGSGASALYQLLDVLPNASNDGVFNAVNGSVLTYNGTKWQAGTIHVPTNLSEFTNDSGFITSAAIPTKLSAFTNDSGFITSAAIPTSLKNPYALKFGSQSYDGSSAKTITAGDLGALTSHQNIYALTIKANDATVLTFTPNSAAGSIAFVAGSNISLSADDTNKKITIANTYSYTHPSGGANVTIAAAAGKVLGAITVNSLGHVTSVSAKTLVAADVTDLADVLDDYATITYVNDELAYTNETVSALVEKVNNFLEGTDTDGIINKWKELEAFLAGQTQTSTLADLLNVKAFASTKIIAGTGLTGGGDLTADRTLSLAASGVTAGTYPKVTVDQYGRVTAGSSLLVDDIPNLPWSKITSGKPTTLTGYGITDGVNSVKVSGSGNAVTAASVSGHVLTLTKGTSFLPQSSFDDLFEKVLLEDGKTYAIRAKYGFYSDSFVSAKGLNPSSSGGGSGASALYQLLDVVPNSTGTGVQGAVSGTVLMYNGSKWKAGIIGVPNALSQLTNDAGFITSAALPTKVSQLNNDAGYITGIDSSMVISALGYTPYNSSNPNGYISSISKSMVEGVLTGNITSHTHNYAGSSFAGGSAKSAETLRYTSRVNTKYGNYVVFQQEYNQSSFPHTGWFNSIKMLHENKAGYFTEIATSFSGEDGMWRRGLRVGTEFGWYKLLDSGNYNSYVPTLTGTGATGTWDISINGNASTASKLNNALTIQANGTSLGTYNGSAAKTFNLTYANVGAAAAEHTHSQYLTEHQSIYSLIFNAGTFIHDIYTPNSEAKTINIPTTTSHIREGNNLYFTNQRAVNALSATLLGYQPLISDLEIIRNSAAEGHTAYGWGNHANAGYLTGITKAMVENVLTGDITSHTHTFASITSKPTTIAGYGITDALTTSNYNSYCPTLTGIGASGTWLINVTGSAGKLYNNNNYINDLNSPVWGEIDNFSINYNFCNHSASNAPIDLDNANLIMNIQHGKHGTSGQFGWQVGFFHSPNAPYIRKWTSGSTGDWDKLLTSGNYNEFSPSLTGSGASGTWDINISGNAATATNAGNADTLDGLHSISFIRNEGITSTSSVSVDANSVLANAVKHDYRWVNTPINAIASLLDLTYSYDWRSQIFVRPYDRTYIAVRSRYLGTTWGDWRELAFTDSNVASATKLQTPRTIWGQSFDGTGNVDGNLTANGNISATGAITAKASSSDIRLKTDISDYKALSIIRGHRSIKYHWNDVAKDNSDVFKDDDWHYGLIAQEMQKDMPQMVSDVFKDYLVINYERLIPICWKGLQEVDDEVSRLKKKVRKLEKEISELKQGA